MSNYSSSAQHQFIHPSIASCSPVSTHPFPTFYLCHLLLMLPSGIHQRVGYLIVQTQARQLSLAMTLLGHRGGGALRFPFDIIRYLLGTASPEGHHNAISFLYVGPYNSFQYFILHSPSIISSNTEKSGEPTKCVVLYFPPPRSLRPSNIQRIGLQHFGLPSLALQIRLKWHLPPPTQPEPSHMHISGAVTCG